MTNIKPLPTRYKGIKFRSRLEARWAVFFDALNIKWRYEFEGYDLGGGDWYLPDFWFPEWDVYGEVKPCGGDFRKAEKFALKTGLQILLLEDVPAVSSYRFLKGIKTYSPNEEDFVACVEVGICWDVAYRDCRLYGDPLFNPEQLEENPESDIAYGQSVFVNDKDEVTGNHINNLNVLDNKLWKNDFCIDGKELLAKYMLIINIIPNAGAVVFKRNLIENINWEKILGFKLAGDRLFWSGIFMNTKVCFVAKNLNYFRIDGDTVRSRNIYTLKYLKEIQSVVFFICNNVNASFKNKTRAVKQWLIYLRNAIKYNKNKGVGFYFHSAYLYVKLLTIYIR